MITIHCTPIINRIAFKPDTTDYGIQKISKFNGKIIFLKNNNGHKISGCLLLCKSSKHVILSFRGQGGNFSDNIAGLACLRDLGYHVFSIDYQGYGLSEGKPSEKSNYINSDLAFTFLTDSLNYKSEDIFVIGRSVGTTNATYIAQRNKIGGLILIQPLTSGKEYIKYHTLNIFSVFAGKSFDNESRIKDIKCPLLVIHGTKDNVIPLSMGKKIFNLCHTPKKFVSIHNANHENIDSLGNDIINTSISEFINKYKN